MPRRPPRPLHPMVLARIVPDTWISVHGMLGLEGEERQAGHTTHQMRKAPQGAFFVWCNERTGYPIDLARDLGRSDLQIVSSDWLWREEAMRSPHRLPIVVDHAVKLT